VPSACLRLFLASFSRLCYPSAFLACCTVSFPSRLSAPGSHPPPRRPRATTTITARAQTGILLFSGRRVACVSYSGLLWQATHFCSRLLNLFPSSHVLHVAVVAISGGLLHFVADAGLRCSPSRCVFATLPASSLRHPKSIPRVCAYVPIARLPAPRLLDSSSLSRAHLESTPPACTAPFLPPIFTAPRLASLIARLSCHHACLAAHLA
jgi:hypothetical protein